MRVDEIQFFKLIVYSNLATDSMNIKQLGEQLRSLKNWYFASWDQPVVGVALDALPPVEEEKEVRAAA